MSKNNSRYRNSGFFGFPDFWKMRIYCSLLITLLCMSYMHKTVISNLTCQKNKKKAREVVMLPLLPDNALLYLSVTISPPCFTVFFFDMDIRSSFASTASIGNNAELSPISFAFTSSRLLASIASIISA